VSHHITTTQHLNSDSDNYRIYSNASGGNSTMKKCQMYI